MLLSGSRQPSEGEAISKEKSSAAEKLADEAKRRALNPMASTQTLSDSQAEPEFQENHKQQTVRRVKLNSAILKMKARVLMVCG